ncbi:hypothetical protein NVP1246O_27 [Vibrio phage 1.246.O._10N.261.54.E10]|nr:hypothetical protein NVP1246O_27 [Vibrio phage 1.246.O._10N.261.54.E10]
MKERVKVGITKEAYEQLQCVDFSDVDVRLKGLMCELSPDGKTEKDHCAILDIELPQEENQMNIDKVEMRTEHQEEMSEFSGEVEWNGEGLPPVGAIYTTEPDFDIELLCKYSSKYVVIGEILPKERHNGVEVVIDTFAQRDRVFRKPETPQQREDRERLEAAYDLYCTWRGEKPASFEDFKRCNHDNWLAIVRKTNYRKG